MVSSSFDIGLEKESSKHLKRERERARERLSVPIANFFHEIYHPWHPYIDTYDTPQLYHTMPRMAPRISVFLFAGKERMGWTCTLYRDASQVPYGHHWQATAACGTQSHGQMVSRMEGRVLFKYFCIYVSILRYTQHVDFKDQDTKTSCTDIFDGFLAYFAKDTGRRRKGSSYFLNPRPVQWFLCTGCEIWVHLDQGFCWLIFVRGAPRKVWWIFSLI